MSGQEMFFEVMFPSGTKLAIRAFKGRFFPATFEVPVGPQRFPVQINLVALIARES